VYDVTARRATWAPIGTEIVSWHWVGVPDKYKGPRTFSTYEDAEAWAGKTSGRVHEDYTLRAPDGTTWSLWLHLPEPYQRNGAIGSVVVDRSYHTVTFTFRQDAAVFTTPEEAKAHAERLGRRSVSERLWFRAPDGERFAVSGAREQ
jgi:hypothetical protein